MKSIKKNTLLSDENKNICCSSLQKYFLENFEYEITDFQASLLIEHIEENIGNFFYNKGVEDSIFFTKEKADDLYLIMRD